jgi:hypothetical protein
LKGGDGAGLVAVALLLDFLHELDKLGVFGVAALAKLLLVVDVQLIVRDVSHEKVLLPPIIPKGQEDSN